MRVLDKNEVNEVSGGLFGLFAIKRAILGKLVHRPAPHHHHHPRPAPKHPC